MPRRNRPKGAMDEAERKMRKWGLKDYKDPYWSVNRKWGNIWTKKNKK